VVSFTSEGMEMQPKRTGPQEFPYIDAFSTIIDNSFAIECNYCPYCSPNETEAERHFIESHRVIFDENYPKKHLDEKTGKYWFIPNLESIEHGKYMLDDINFYMKFNSFCSYDKQPLSDIELQAVEKQPDGTYVYKEELLLPKEFPKLPKQPKPTKDPKHDKIKHIYSYNVGAAKVTEVKQKLVEQGVKESDIYTKENKKGNYFVYYYK
jgi:hypothetical protein